MRRSKQTYKIITSRVLCSSVHDTGDETLDLIAKKGSSSDTEQTVWYTVQSQRKQNKQLSTTPAV